MARKVDVIAQFKEQGIDNVIGSAKGMLNTLQAIEEVKEWIQLAQNWTKEWAQNMYELGTASEQVKSYFGWVEKISKTSSSMGDTVFTELNKGLKIVDEAFSNFMTDLDPARVKLLVQDVMVIAAKSVKLLGETAYWAADAMYYLGNTIYGLSSIASGFGIKTFDAMSNLVEDYTILITQGKTAADQYVKKNGTFLDILMGTDPNATTRQKDIAAVQNVIQDAQGRFTQSIQNNKTLLADFNKMIDEIETKLSDPKFGQLPPAERQYGEKELTDLKKIDDYWDDALVKWQTKYFKAFRENNILQLKLSEDLYKAIGERDENHRKNLDDAAKERDAVLEEERKKKLDKMKAFYKEEIGEIFNIGSALKNEVVNRLQDAIMNGKSLNEVFKDFDLGKFLTAQAVSAIFNIAGNAASFGILNALGLGYSGGPAKGLASGGSVGSGMPGQDSVLALLDPREYVIPGSLVEAIKNDKRPGPSINSKKSSGLTVVINAQPMDSPVYWDSLIKKHIGPGLARRGYV